MTNVVAINGINAEFNYTASRIELQEVAMAG